MTSQCIISLHGGEEITDVQFGLPAGQTVPIIPPDISLQFLSLVETARIPLYLSTGQTCPVSTNSADTERWFRNVLLNSEFNGESRWWEAARVDSPLGILVSVPISDDGGRKSQPRVTELLFYLAQGESQTGRPPTPPLPSPNPNDESSENKPGPVLGVYALALSSDLLCQSVTSEPTPPASPSETDGELDAVFRPQPFLDELQAVNQPPVRKRKSAVDVFDEANERHKKARRKGGEGVSAAAVPKSEPQVPTLHHRRSSSNTQPIPRPLSRSPSVVSSRPATAVSSGARRSALSRVQTAADASDVSDIESKNKDTISRIVMAGMRLYGLSQSKQRRKSRPGSAAPSSCADEEFDKLEAERQSKDEEFKLIYHQVFKGTCLAFRAVLGIQQLHLFPNATRDVADRLLSIFCSDPLAKDEQDAFRPGNTGTELGR